MSGSLNALPQERMLCRLRPLTRRRWSARKPRRAWPSALGQDSVVETSRDASPCRADVAGGVSEDRVLRGRVIRSGGDGDVPYGPGESRQHGLRVAVVPIAVQEHMDCIGVPPIPSSE